MFPIRAISKQLLHLSPISRGIKSISSRLAPPRVSSAIRGTPFSTKANASSLRMRSMIRPLALLGTSAFLLGNALFAQSPSLPPSVSNSAPTEQQPVIAEKIDRIAALKKELGLSDNNGPIAPEDACHIIFAQAGESIYNVENRLQGQINVPLSDIGRENVKKVAEQLAGVEFSAIFCSDLDRSTETASILAQEHVCSLISDPALRGESHGKLDGLLQKEYHQDPHFKQYKSLTAVEKIFFPVGEGGESKADVARRMIPVLKRICEENRGKTIVIVLHGGNIKFLNFLMGNYTDESFADIRGTFLRVDSDGRSFVPQN